MSNWYKRIPIYEGAGGEYVDPGKVIELEINFIEAIEALEECYIFLNALEIESDEDSCMGAAFIKNRVSEDGYYIALNLLKKLLEKVGKNGRI